MINLKWIDYSISETDELFNDAVKVVAELWQNKRIFIAKKIFYWLYFWYIKLRIDFQNQNYMD